MKVCAHHHPELVVTTIATSTKVSIVLIDGLYFWDEADHVKRRLFNHLRTLTRIDYTNYERYRRRFAEIPEQLLAEWNSLESEYRRRSPRIVPRLRGFLFELLFYFACLDSQAIFLDAEITELQPYPPWMEATPLYDIIPSIHQIREGSTWTRKAPQTTADFIVSYVDDEGPAAPSLVDVKSKKPSRKRTKDMGWQVTAAMRRGFIFQVAYPKNGIALPRSLKDWEVRTSCSSCGAMSVSYEKCDDCGKAIFKFSIVSGYYEAKELRRKQGEVRTR